MAMSLLRNLIRPYFYTRYGFHRLTGTGAFKTGRVRYVHAGARSWWNPLKRALWNAHVKQLQESSCSVASVVTCINAICAMQNGNCVTATQTGILDRVTTGHWKERMSDNGYRGRRGLPLPVLGRVIEESLNIYGLKYQSVEVVRTPKNLPRRSPVRTTLKKRLHEFDRHGNGLIVAHFDQGSLAPTLNIPHISPVGAYDAAIGRVTVLDVDPEQEHPYEVDFDTFYRGISCDYHHVLEAYGYGSGGYVYIRLR
jgi:hypothetical protein